MNTFWAIRIQNGCVIVCISSQNDASTKAFLVHFPRWRQLSAENLNMFKYSHHSLLLNIPFHKNKMSIFFIIISWWIEKLWCILTRLGHHAMRTSNCSGSPCSEMEETPSCLASFTTKNRHRLSWHAGRIIEAFFDVLWTYSQFLVLYSFHNLHRIETHIYSCDFTASWIAK